MINKIPMINELADYYVQSNYNDMSHCLNHYNNEDEECKNAPFKKFLDRNMEDPQGLLSRVKNLQDAYQKLREEHQQLQRHGCKEKFINIPKKNNERVYVILFVLAVFLFCKLKK
tara:strand:+ start:293 stop:637 length:345 start_codon:yes stop_codon:yes gene_type:complete